MTPTDKTPDVAEQRAATADLDPTTRAIIERRKDETK